MRGRWEALWRDKQPTTGDSLIARAIGAKGAQPPFNRMFEGITENLSKALRNLRGLGKLTDENMAEALGEVRKALLSADVHFKVARDFTERVRAECVGLEVVKSVTPGQQVGAGQQIATIKVTDRFKVHASLNEYYVDRITTGLPATISYQGRKYPLRVSRVVPEVKDRSFDVDLLFTDEVPENVRLGKSFRVQIELGQPERALVVGRGNFYQQTGGRWIYKLNADKTRAVKVPIQIGRQNPVQYEIVEGLQTGDWVITTGYDNFGDVEELVF